MSTQSEQHTPEQLHRREVRLYILLPIWGAVAIMAVALALVILALSPLQFSMVANCMLSTFILVPIVLTCLLPTILLMTAAIGLWKLNAVAAPPLARNREKATAFLASLRERVPSLARPVVALQGRVSYWERILTGRSTSVSAPPEEERLQ